MIETKETRGYRWLEVLLWAVLAGYLVVFAILNFKGMVHFGNGDIYGDVLISRYLWESGSVFPAGWAFSNQTFLLATPNLSALFYGITGNLNLSMALAVTIMGVLCLAAFAWLLRPVTGRLGTAAALALFAAYVYNENAGNPAFDTDPMVTRISDLGQLLFLTVSYYSIYFIALCLLWGWYLRAAFLKKQGRGMNIMFVLCAALCFTTGMQSLRQLQIAILPLWGVEVLRLLAASRWFRQKPAKADWIITLKAALCTAANGAGLVLFYALAPIGGMGGVAVGQEDFKRKLIGAYAASKSAANLQKPSLWAAGSAPLQLCYFALALLVAVFVVWALTRIPVGMGETAACCGLFVASLLLTLISMLLTSVGTTSRYLFLYWPLAAVAVAWGMNRLPGRGKAVLAVLIVAFASLNFWFSYKPLVQSCFDEEPLPQQQAADWLADNGYETVYGQFWTVGPIGLAANGKVDAGHWVFTNFYEISPYLTAEDLYTEEANDKAVYLFTEQDRDRGVAAAEKAGVTLELQAEIADTYYIYTSPVQLMHHTEDAGRDSGY